MLEDVYLTSLKIIENPKGNILHGLKNTEEVFSQFGEAYFSKIKKGEIKGWKKHSKMKLNIIVPLGAIKFYLIDHKKGSSTYNMNMKVELSLLNYSRLTVPPGCWIAFEGMEEDNMLLNIASITHDPSEAETRDFSYFSI
ncbi:hypothetical protein APR41_10720 [Salegentibacter salinarum]|uniref:dTDP-4-dehydrorhamnose 3,5-epimerase n=1 Tax=Salegentibacter salinarum TaxID=447422 RepID=A0A2N0TNH6_9FLAO|nr:hypothetical protein APR41_10720 [Salegentibacter salinarum]